jgi:nondiscriminating glutamyl-tRNA synthetase
LAGSIRVRFAPSPTGYLHVGGARTAIFNWLFARHHGGTFVLRIEDTDVDRSSGASEASLIDDLRWLGIDWDEGPDCGGSLGPYRQSERLDHYRAEAEKLVEAGIAYPCFCSDELLAAKRREATKKKIAPGYDGTCRSLTADEIEAHRKQGQPEVFRFKVPDDVIRIEDLVRGTVELATDTVGDFVLLRSNGMPTYNFAAALDDHRMGITHVLRGEEHLPNTLRQILVYRSLDAEPPQFGHLPLILAEDRSKLSKRHGASSVGQLRELGFLPAGVVNYLVLLGWSHPDGKEILSSDELIEGFTLDRVNKSAAVYDPKKMTWMNGRYVHAMPLDELFPIADPFFPDFIRDTCPEDVRKHILGILHDSVETLGDLPEHSLPFRSPPDIEEEAVEVLGSSASEAVLSALKAALEGGSEGFTPGDFKSMMKVVGKETSLKGKDLFFPVRAALTGSVHGPDLASIAALKGKSIVLELIERARSYRASS